MRRSPLSALALIALALLAAPTLADQPEPIDDLQRLFIEDTVSLIHPPSAPVGVKARALMDLAGKARARGDLGQMRRFLAEARVLLAGGEWNADVSFLHSLSVVPNFRVIDPALPLQVTVRQWYGAKPESGQIKLRLGFRRKGAAGMFWADWSAPLSAQQIRQGHRTVPSMEELADGSYDLVVEVRLGDRSLGQTSQVVWIVHEIARESADIDRRVAALKPREALRTTLQCPKSFAATLSNRTRQPSETDWRAWLDRTKAMLAKAEAGTDPLKGAKGDITRCYWSSGEARAEPFRVYVPQSWDGKSPLGLVVLLHGSNGDHNRMLNNPEVAKLAEKHGWAVLSPMGYSPNSGWGNHRPVVLANGTMPAPRPSTIAGVVLRKDGVFPEPAVEDVFATLRELRRDYPLDWSRIYLGGNSMGGEGAWHLGQLRPDLWAAIAPGAGAIDPAHYPYERLGKLPVLAVHGDADPIISFAASADMIARLNKAGGKGELLRVNGGGHSSFDTVLPQIFNFFAHQEKKP